MTPKGYSQTHGPAKPIRRPKCGAIKQNKLPCGNPAGYGTDHPGMGPCMHHFGNTDRVVRSSALEEGKEMARVLKGMGVAADMDPGEALRWEVNNTLGHIAWHRRVIDQWDLMKPDGTARPLTENEEAFYERYLAERAHLIRGARMAIAGDVENRAMRLAEAQAEMVADAMDRVFAELRLTPEQRDALPELLPGFLREISARPPLQIEGTFAEEDGLMQRVEASRREGRLK